MNYSFSQNQMNSLEFSISQTIDYLNEILRDEIDEEILEISLIQKEELLEIQNQIESSYR